MQDFTELVLVCCHSIFNGDHGTYHDEPNWSLQPYQRSDPSIGKPGDHETFVAHIVTAAMAVEARPQAMLMFSGGRTGDTELSEADSYTQVMATISPHFHDIAERSSREERATDSYQNLLFSIIRFHQLAGRWPQYVTVITHAFKQRRFLDLHAPAIRWPTDRIRVQGLNPPVNAKELDEVTHGERERAFNMFVEDPYGVHGPLAEKRKARRWDPSTAAKMADALVGEHALKRLLLWQGGDDGKQIFPDHLPWEDQ